MNGLKKYMNSSQVIPHWGCVLLYVSFLMEGTFFIDSVGVPEIVIINEND